ncbi:formylglycine-generating enzyme family protein [Halalkalibacterium halodurans]|uniref:formylglycine-generating enzyme family protein n=1 Tax=Halalkalibacterium halodurans TaxID=86665 RepID=UPI002AAA4CA9|nr:formylglycine-generating enzyme family protein [Halalkalibacterium halodurans]MDY7221398.1 formylglycine-generating enzyme family protein [Halalkalibacterium halodurans]MDY7240637.1 formylglycine-generating enzyme family protein [Halalkalibacterium halodurans]
MRKRFIFLVIVMIVASACSQVKTVNSENPVSNDHLVLVEGGTFTSTKTNDYEETITIDDFYIGKYEVTQKEWMDVMGSNPSHFKGDDLPVEMVSWYDAIEYCNKRSIKEGLEPYYNINKNELDPNNKSEYDHIKWTVTINEGANGYRLPTEVEWEYAASGGQLSESYTYSGSHNVDEVAWYWRNAGDQYLSGDWSWPTIENNNNQTNSVGLKEPNELGLFDMSGNVREWCWDWYGELGGDNESGSLRVVKGGGWLGDVSSNEISFRGKFEASGIGPDQGFRVARNK